MTKRRLASLAAVLTAVSFSAAPAAAQFAVWLIAQPGAALIPQATGTAIGNMSAGGGLAACFNGTVPDKFQATASGCQLASATGEAYIGKDWGAGNAKAIQQITIDSTTDSDFAAAGSIAIYYRTSSDCSTYGSPVTLQATQTYLNSTRYTFSGLTAPAARCIEVEFSANGANNRRASQVFFYGQ